MTIEAMSRYLGVDMDEQQFWNSCTPWSSSAGDDTEQASRPQTTPPGRWHGHGGPVIDSPTCR